ncbi:hypothetical protein M231_03305 [Tremella mesenterica]|uniref:Uncharacterized protein n=1 Tax=Tremella mesenterica TaxID=5217 RepID=A0A4Q1BP04_TREME|nr:hypothetical protein M231_03305 [Tremella mesenterica]
MLPTPGSAQFLPALIAHIESSTPWTFTQPLADLFAAILLTLIVNKGGLILDISPENLDDVLDLAHAVRVICQNIFGLPASTTHLDHNSAQSILNHSFISDPPHSHSPLLTSPLNSVSPLNTNFRRRSKSLRSVTTPTSLRPRSRTSTFSGYRHRLSMGTNTPPLATHDEHTGPYHLHQDHVADPSNPSEISHGAKGNNGRRAGTVSNGDGLKVAEGTIPAEEEKNGKGREMAQVVILTGLEDTPSPLRVKLVDILLKRQVERYGAEVDLPDTCLVIWIRREGAKGGPGWLVDQFAYSSPTPSLDVPDLPHKEFQPLIPRAYIHHLRLLLPYTHIHPPLQIHISNLVSSLHSHPRLSSTLTSRSVLLLPDLVRAHRLLSRRFDLPPNWQSALSSTRIEGDELGVGGGKGGVLTWAKVAGEEPSLSQLYSMTAKVNSLGQPLSDSKASEDIPEVMSQQMGVLRGLPGEEWEEWEGEDWYASPLDVSGVFEGCVRHRLEWRDEGEEIMWLLRGGAGRLLSSDQRDGRSDQPGKIRDAVRRRRKIERVIRDVLDSV